MPRVRLAELRDVICNFAAVVGGEIIMASAQEPQQRR